VIPTIHQWDVVRVRINPADRDEHPAVVISCEEFCLNLERSKLNVLYGTSRRPGEDREPYEITLNGADGLERPTVFNCGHLYTIDRQKISATVGRVAPERRRQIGRTIVSIFRLPL
jgi:mRNA-degrading endonuclease toxin of MazEF toxin-antitoxin module